MSNMIIAIKEVIVDGNKLFAGAGCLLAFATVFFGLALVCGYYLFLAWLVCYVATGFGYPLPFWPVAGSWFLLHVMVKVVRGKNA